MIAYGNRPELPQTAELFASSGRISVRLRSDDLLLLRERSNARTMPTSTYVSLLVRAHLRALTPLPTAELAALKRAVAEIGAIVAGWLAVSERLQAEGDSHLAGRIRSFVARMAPVQSEKEMLADVMRSVGRGGNARSRFPRASVDPAVWTTVFRLI